MLLQVLMFNWFNGIKLSDSGTSCAEKFIPKVDFTQNIKMLIFFLFFFHWSDSINFVQFYLFLYIPASKKDSIFMLLMQSDKV